jgi:ATP-dependent helicase/nuclease subunit B
VSASRLETWAKCPLRYYLGQVLKLGDRDDPERTTELSAMDRGSLVHTVLEIFIQEAIDRPGGPPAPNEAWTDADRHRIRGIAAEVFAQYHAEGRTGRALTWQRTRADLLADLDTFLTADDAHRAANGVRPAHTEMPFGVKGEPPLSIELDDGRVLTFRGFADRVDVADDGRAVVLDYKTGGGKYGTLDEDPVQEGTTLQLGIYAEAAKDRLGADEVDTHYWMTSAKGGFVKHGYEWDDDRRERFLGVVEAVVDGIEGGVFPGRSGPFNSFWGSHESCGFCDFDRICPRDRDEHELAKADAPELSLLERLLPPEPEVDE